MKVAVTGATGFIGRHLVKGLLMAGHEVVALTHHRQPPAWNGGAPITAAASVDDMSALQAAFAGVEVVYHLVGIIAETRNKTFEVTVVGGTANVISACRASGVSKVVYLSAMGTSPEAPSRYHQAKHRAETSVRQSGLHFLILRPSVVYGPGDGFVSLLASMVKGLPVVPIVGSGRYQLQPVHVDDLVRVMAQALKLESCWNQTVEIGGPEKLEYRQVLEHIMQVLGRKRPTVRVPLAPLRLAVGALERVIKPSPLTRDQLIMMAMGNTGDISKMKELFGVEPIRFADGLASYLRKI